jgi:glycosyltransferase involved in cell wall biosynthesis
MRRGYKNFDNMLRAYASSGSLRKEFDLIAFGSNSFTPDETEFIRALGLSGRQVRHLAGDDLLLKRLYECAVAFVFPSLYEGFGIPLLEAMGCGCPVLCNNSSSIPEIVGDAGLYCDARQPDAIADAMERVASSTELRTTMMARGNERVKLFSWDRCAAETLEVYRSLLQ